MISVSKVLRPWFAIWAFAVTNTPVWASSSPEVEVRAVRFNLLPAPNTSARWFEADVEVGVRATSGVRFADHVRVGLNLGLKEPGGTIRYYRATAEAVALDVGAAHFRFYLPAEVVKRDSLRGGADFWAVELAVKGSPAAPSPRSRAPTLQAATQMREFLAQVATGAPANDGVLQPQYLTPFAPAYPRETPTFIRRN
jgi:hypothetical protein